MDAKELHPEKSRPRLERRNGMRNSEYEAPAGASWFSSSSASLDESPDLLTTRSLEVSPWFSQQTSFRIGRSIDLDFDMLYNYLGISGPDDFAIPIAAWEARKALSSSDLFPLSRLLQPDGPTQKDFSFLPEDQTSVPNVLSESSCPPAEENISLQILGVGADMKDPLPSTRSDGGIVGIRGARPPVLGPPIVQPPSQTPLPVFSSQDEDDEDSLMGEAAIEETSLDSSGTSSMSTLNDDDASSTTTETMFMVSPNGRFKRTIKLWEKGACLGRGSFGTVYEGISDEGVFFAVKEVSLLDHGLHSQKSIFQLEQEIALLSQFEHENIVQYYGSDKDDSELFIFLELVTQGSLASLYQKYHLQDTQVSAYTRQILKGLNYLHKRDVVHRDVKCANVLVHANGSVKLADFGLSKKITKVNMLKSCTGSVYWMAPEVVDPGRTYGPPADIWSLGCTVLEMLTRKVPYPGLEWEQAFFKIGQGEPPHIPNRLSELAHDFISQCVKCNPDDRPTASQLLEHPFVKR